jgi:VIT1/CCC1 family predicted Fe2+/Mn2+ transporter/rubrerythrin
MKPSKHWLHHLQDEEDARFIYEFLAAQEADERKRTLFTQLAAVEAQHKARWQQLLVDNQMPVPKVQPSFQSKLQVWLTRFFGIRLLERWMLAEEGNEVKAYLNLYNAATDASTRHLAKELAIDSAMHADKLANLKAGSNGESWHKSESGGMLRNVIYGFNDGLTANFGLIAGVVGASVESHIILISGISGMLADALSMGSSGYLAAKSEREVYENERRMEAQEIELMPDLETQELALLYQAKGMSQAQAEKLAAQVMLDPARALREKEREELGISESATSPLKEAWVTGIATAVGAFIPILPFFVLEHQPALWTSFVVSMLAHFVVGAARSFFTGARLWKSGWEMFLVGFGVAAVGYGIGELVTRW